MSHKAYQQLQQAADSASETEYRLFGQVTGALMEARDKAYSGVKLIDPLDWNRRMWTTLSTDCSVEGNGLPDKLRAGIISLAIFVNRHTSEVMRGEADIDDLININRQIMEGLAQQAAAARQQQAEAQTQAETSIAEGDTAHFHTDTSG